MKKIAKKNAIKAYKVFGPDWKCRGFQFAVGEAYEHKGAVEICRLGFHACVQIEHCFSYYSFNSANKVAEVLIWGKTDAHDEDSKLCGSQIQIVREVEWSEVLALANHGMDNTGHSNTGDSNTGYRNAGNRNTGDSNTGDSNTGYRNTGDSNTGDRNTGDSNTGNWNTGDSNTGDSNTGYRNTGDSNTGYRNTGDSNTGDRNTGDSNTGNWNTGDSNTGYSNTGDRNTGYRNAGDRNTGNWNTGDSNTGDSNTGYRNTGAFCVDDNPEVLLFDKPSGIKVRDWEKHQVVRVMGSLEIAFWTPSWSMTEQEKTDHPSWQTTDGYLKNITLHEAWANLWGNLDDENKQVFLDLPNFDVAKWLEITGIEV